MQKRDLGREGEDAFSEKFENPVTKIRVGPNANRMTWDFIFKKHSVSRLRSRLIINL